MLLLISRVQTIGCVRFDKADAQCPVVPSVIHQLVGGKLIGSWKAIQMLFLTYYVAAMAVLILHFTGVLERHNLEWMVLAEAVTVFPAVIYL